MSEIRNIYATFQEDNPLVCVREVEWHGTIIIEEDGWFEGMINNIREERPYRILVFGYLIPDKEIDLYQALPYSGLMWPHHYECSNHSGYYEGRVTMGMVTIGDASIGISSPIELSQREIDSLEQEMAEYDVWFLIGNSRSVYTRMCREREQLQKQIKEPKDNFNEEVSLLKRKKYK